MNAIAHIHIEAPWLTKQGFIAGAAAAMLVAGGFALAIRLRFHKYAPQQLAIGLAFDQQAADELGGDNLGGAGEEALGEGWEGADGFGSGFRRIDRENYINIQSKPTRNSALKPSMTPSAATKSTFLATMLILAWQHAAKAQMVGTTIKCNNGTMLRVRSKKEYLATFQYGNVKFTLADTTPHGATFSVYGDTQSPAGTGISFSNHGIGGQIKGKEFIC